jgi:hypothetical protein
MQGLCKTSTSGIELAVRRGDGEGVAVAVAPTRNIRTLHLAQPLVQTGSWFEGAALSALLLTAAGLWMLVIPLELLGSIA